jgi:hypothetical protein
MATTRDARKRTTQPSSGRPARPARNPTSTATTKWHQTAGSSLPEPTSGPLSSPKRAAPRQARAIPDSGVRMPLDISSKGRPSMPDRARHSRARPQRRRWSYLTELPPSLCQRRAFTSLRQPFLSAAPSRPALPSSPPPPVGDGLASRPQGQAQSPDSRARIGVVLGRGHEPRDS